MLPWRLLQLQQPLEVAALDVGAERVAEPLANRLENLAGALHVDLVGHLHRIAEIGSAAGAWSAQRIAAGVLLAAAFLAAALVALHRLQLLHHLLGALAQRFQRATLV